MYSFLWWAQNPITANINSIKWFSSEIVWRMFEKVPKPKVSWMSLLFNFPLNRPWKLLCSLVTHLNRSTTSPKHAVTIIARLVSNYNAISQLARMPLPKLGIWSGNQLENRDTIYTGISAIASFHRLLLIHLSPVPRNDILITHRPHASLRWSGFIFSFLGVSIINTLYWFSSVYLSRLSLYHFMLYILNINIDLTNSAAFSNLPKFGNSDNRWRIGCK